MSPNVPELHQWDHRMEDGIADLLALLRFAPLTHLEIAGRCSIVGVGTWARLFQAFPSLMSLRAGASGSIFTGLHQASFASSAGRPIICQRLERIAINDYQETIEWPESLFYPLISCLGYRATEGGMRLKKLQLDLHEDMDKEILRYLPDLEDLVLKVVFVPGYRKDTSEDSDESSDDEAGEESDAESLEDGSDVRE